MGTTNRDDFSQTVKDTLAKRAGFLCSNPDCKQPTIGAQAGGEKSISIGIAAHITAAAPGGPRYDASLTSEERSSADNGIWLCSNCSIMIDKDEDKYTVELLKHWKQQAEETSHCRISHSNCKSSLSNSSADIYKLSLLYEDLSVCLKSLSLFELSPHIIIDSDNFPLPSNWVSLLEDNNAFLGLPFTLELNKICNHIDKLNNLMNEEKERIKKQYPRHKVGRIADAGAVSYCNRLESITSILFKSFTPDTLNSLAQKLQVT